MKPAYSGLMLLIARNLSLITGFLFTLLVVRSLSLQEFGDFQFVSSLLYYFTFPSLIVTYWALRDSARGEFNLKSSLSLSLILGVFFFLLFLLSSSPSSQILKIDYLLFFVASFQIFVIYLLKVMESSALGRNPSLEAFSLIILEVSKLAFGFYLLRFLNYGILGALISIIMAQLIQALILLYKFRPLLKIAINKGLFKKWITLAWLPLFSNLSYLILNLDAVIVSLITLDTNSLALYKASLSLTQVIYNISIFSVPLYPFLLAGGKVKYSNSMLKISLLLSTPATIALIVLAEPLLYLLRPDYIIASNGLRILSLAALIMVLSNFFEIVILGKERVDVEKDSKLKDYLASKLFKIPLINLISNTIYLSLLAFISFFLVLNRSYEPMNLMEYWSLITLFSYLMAFLVKFRIVKREQKISINFGSWLKYSLASLPMALALYLYKINLNMNLRFFPLLSHLTVMTILGLVIYSVVLFLIDDEFRELAKNLLIKFKIFLTKHEEEKIES